MFGRGRILCERLCRARSTPDKSTMNTNVTFESRALSFAANIEDVDNLQIFTLATIRCYVISVLYNLSVLYNITYLATYFL